MKTGQKFKAGHLARLVSALDAFAASSWPYGGERRGSEAHWQEVLAALNAAEWLGDSLTDDASAVTCEECKKLPIAERRVDGPVAPGRPVDVDPREGKRATLSPGNSMLQSRGGLPGTVAQRKECKRLG